MGLLDLPQSARMQSNSQQNLHLGEQLLPVKEELLSENDSLALCEVNPAIKLETCPCTGDCLHCLQTDEPKEAHRNDSSSLACPSSGGDLDNMPSDWFSGASSDSEESIVYDEPVINFPIKEEPESEESLSPLASPRPASPSIVVKGETCQCTGDCLHCLPKRSPPCPECGKTFYANSDLKKHQSVHTGERPYVCAQCPKAFTQLGTLTRHQLTHQAVRSRPFRCTAEGCGKAFARKGELTVHIRSHTGDKPYKCGSCGKGCTTKGDLTRHTRTHTGDRPYHCPLCPKAFSQSSAAKRHQRRAHPMSP